MYSPGQGIRLRSSARTNTGKVRENNEDNVFLWGRENFVLAIVADGMGGAAAGEEASRIAVETINESLMQSDIQQDGHYDALSADVVNDRLRDVIRSANDKIVQRAIKSPEMKGMGTTVTLALVRDTYAVIGHVGDSRAYLVDGQDGSISQITSDHSFVEAMVAAGHITRDEAEDHPMRNVLYRALGQADDIDVDVYHSYLRVGDRLVLCSDGLTLHVKPDEIAEVSLSHDRPETASQQLIDLTNERGGRDNVSVVVIAVEEDESIESNNNALSGDFVPGDDDTLILRERDRKSFVSSESDNSPNIEMQDSVRFPDYRRDSKLGTTAPESLSRRQPSHDALNEGRDTFDPDEA